MRGKNRCYAVNAKNAPGKELAEVKKMCQQKTIQVLKKNKRWMTARKIYETSGEVSFASISHNLSRLRKSGQITSRMTKMTTKDGRKIPVMEYCLP